jgi:hypothetical protein
METLVATHSRWTTRPPGSCVTPSSFLGSGGFSVKQGLGQLACVALQWPETQVLLRQTAKARIASGNRENGQHNSNGVLHGSVVSFCMG